MSNRSKIYWVHDSYMHHFRQRNGQVVSEMRRRTVGMRYNYDTMLVEYATSTCHPRDNFSRSLGRTIVEGRFASEDYYEASSFDQLAENIGDSEGENSRFSIDLTSLEHCYNSVTSSYFHDTPDDTVSVTEEINFLQEELSRISNRISQLQGSISQ